MPLKIPSDGGPLIFTAEGFLGVGVPEPGVPLDVQGEASFAGFVSIFGGAVIEGGLTLTGGIAPEGAAIAPRCIHTGGMSVTQTSDGNDTTPVITETYIAQVFIPCNVKIIGIAFFNGSAVGTDKLVGILYDSTGVVLANTNLAGVTATVIDNFQRIPLTSPFFATGPANFYVGLQANGTTYRANTHILGNFGASKKTGETFGVPTAITPPTTFTTAVGPIASLY